MCDFTECQEEIIDSFFRTGNINKQQTAVILPALTRWVFRERPELKKDLEKYYGKLQEDVICGLGSDLLQENEDAEILVEVMLSSLRKGH